MTVKELKAITKGRLLQGEHTQPVDGVSINTRTIKRGNAYIAIRGHRLDGHKFVPAALSKGAAVIIVSKRIKCPPGIAVILVKDTTKALGQIAAWHRRQFKVPVIAVTGSAGKTTTKELIAAVLGSKYKVLKNFKTENNHYGVPLTLLNLDNSHQIVVLELGTNQPGDIKWLARIARPDVAVMTNIGESHLEGLKSRKGVFREKTQLLRYMNPKGVAIINADDDLLGRIRKKDHGPRVIRYGQEQKAELTAKNVAIISNRQLAFTVKGHTMRINSPARHNVYNALSAILCGLHFKIRYNDIRIALSRYRFGDARQEIAKIGRFWLINDTYNANPLSLASAVTTLCNLKVPGKRIVVCADMLELGPRSRQLHLKAGRAIAASSADAVITVGRDAGYIAQGAKQTNGIKAIHCKDLQDVHRQLKRLCSPGDAVLVKGSRGMQMERTAEYFKKNFK